MVGIDSLKTKLSDVVQKDLNFLVMASSNEQTISTIRNLLAQLILFDGILEQLRKEIKQANDHDSYAVIIEATLKRLKDELVKLGQCKKQVFLILENAKNNFSDKVTNAHIEQIKGHVEEQYYETTAKLYEVFWALISLSSRTKGDALSWLYNTHTYNEHYKKPLSSILCMLYKNAETLNAWASLAPKRQAFKNNILDFDKFIRDCLRKSPEAPFCSFIAIPAVQDGVGKRKFQRKFTHLCSAIENNELDIMRTIINSDRRLLTINFKDQIIEMHNNLFDNSAACTYTVLSFAASRCNVEAMTVLLKEYNVNPNAPDDSALSPLYQLLSVDQNGFNSYSPAYKAAKLLVEYGANPDQVTAKGTARALVEQTAPSLFDLIKTGFDDKTVGANCRAAFATKDSATVTAWYQFKRNITPLAVVAAGVAAVAGIPIAQTLSSTVRNK
jgi:hypothetical protein